MARMLTLQADPQGAMEDVAQVIRQGGVVALPTESFYAIGASPFDEAAVQRVGRIKGRGQDKPLLVLIAEPAQLEGLVAEVTEGAALLMKRFWPGPLTIVFPALRELPAALTAGTGTVGVRQSAFPPLIGL
ncbi:MAG: Sua5/YciO/YrdC/YwlC family protein, partial [Nitrospira sp.]|nr:Sua5/YciO/YrdC/YwlC family protein [Nitrospira sp.]